MTQRLVALHYTAPPRVGGIEVAAYELAVAASRVSGWQGVLISGTHPSEIKDGNDEVIKTYIPEISTSHPLNREIFEQFRRGIRHPGIESLAQHIQNELDAIIQPGDLLVSFNCLSLPFNIALTSALWAVTQHRNDFLHLTWSSDLAALEDEYDWTRHKEWPWSLMWSACPRVMYAAITSPVALTYSQILGVDPETVRVIHGGINPSACLRLTNRISSICQRHSLMNAYPLLYMPTKISTRKNIPKALTILKSLLREFKDGHLVITGSLSPHDESTQEEADHLLEAIKQADLRKHVTVLSLEEEFQGTVSFEDTMCMMSVCDGVIFTSKREGFLIPVLEANLHSIPIFTPSLSTIMSWASDYVMSYPEDASSDTIAEKLSKTYKLLEARRKYEARTAYSWDNIFAKHFSHLREAGL